MIGYLSWPHDTFLHRIGTAGGPPDAEKAGFRRLPDRKTYSVLAGDYIAIAEDYNAYVNERT